MFRLCIVVFVYNSLGVFCVRLCVCFVSLCIVVYVLCVCESCCVFVCMFCVVLCVLLCTDVLIAFV